MDLSGKRRRLTAYGETVAAVRLKVSGLKDRPIASFDVIKETLTSYLERWLKRVAVENAPRTYESYSWIVNKYISGFIGTIRLAKLTPQDIADFLNISLRAKGPRTRQLVYQVLHHALNEAVADDLIRVNPCRSKFKPRHKSAEFRSLTQEEAQRLLAVARESAHYLLVYLALATGMRQGELLGLRWDTVDLDNRFLSVCATLAWDAQGKPILRQPKGKRHRRIDLTQYAVDLLEEQRNSRSPISPWVFSDANGNPMRKDNLIFRVFKPMLKKAQIGRLRFHDLRHSSATLSLAAGENIKVVQERLGHASAKMTLDVYAKAVPTLQKEAASRLDSILAVNGPRLGPREGISEEKDATKPVI